MAEYKLQMPFFDGQQLHPKGAVMEFEEGKAPPYSKLVVKQPEPAKPAAKK